VKIRKEVLFHAISARINLLLRSIRQHGDDTRASTKHERPKMCWIVEVLLSPPAANVIRRSKTINPQSWIRSLVESNFLAGRRSFSRKEKSPWSISSSVAIIFDVTRKKVTITDFVFWMTISGCKFHEGKKAVNALKWHPKLRYVYCWYICYIIENGIVSVSIKCYISTYLSSINNQFIILMHIYR